MVLAGPIDGPWFVAYVEQVLCTALKAGDIVVLDNLGFSARTSATKSDKPTARAVRIRCRPPLQ